MTNATGTWRVNDATNVITAPDGRTGVFADTDPVYQDYVEHLNAGGTVEHYYEAPPPPPAPWQFQRDFTADEMSAIRDIALASADAQDFRATLVTAGYLAEMAA